MTEKEYDALMKYKNELLFAAQQGHISLEELIKLLLQDYSSININQFKNN